MGGSTHAAVTPTCRGTSRDEPLVEESDMVKFCIGATIATGVFIATFAVITAIVSTYSMASAGY
jgi:hypothetical protein